MTRGRHVLLASVLAASALLACGLSKVGTGDDGVSSGDAATSPTEGGAARYGAVSGDAGLVDAAALETPIFGVTSTNLYRFQPDTLALTNVGVMAGCMDITDIALDANGKMYAGGNGLFTVDPATAACTPISAVTQPFTLTVVPLGTLHPASEALVAFLGADYVEIDSGSGTRRTVTSQSINPYQPSGDVVAELDAGMYVSVTDPTCATDCILEVRPADGTIVKNWGASGSKAVVGLAMSRGVLYGFLGNGDIVRISLAASKATSTVLPVAEKPIWLGAGSRTTQ